MNLNGHKETGFLFYGNLKEINSSSRCHIKIMLQYLFKTDLREKALHSLSEGDFPFKYRPSQSPPYS